MRPIEVEMWSMHSVFEAQIYTAIQDCENYWSRRMYMRGRELSTLVVILFVTLSSREFTLRSSNLNIVCSAATSLSS